MTLFDDEQNTRRRHIESSKFVFVAAKSGVGNPLAGNYLEAIIRGWKHVDGDFPIKNTNKSIQRIQGYYYVRHTFYVRRLRTVHMWTKPVQERLEWHLKEGYTTEFSRLAF